MGGFIETIIGGLFAGIIIGPLGRLVLPGKQDISLIGTILVGAGAAIVGGLIADWIGVGSTSGIDWIKHFIQIALAAGGVVLFASATDSKS
ncbi:MAG: GlsB/YeaQ/YmgE family stress response membrane protein [Actinomycetota bacterium]|nr:GlsB/YeaQ/YmgE family stress response membrane protein [Actinomycetota bacterium]